MIKRRGKKRPSNNLYKLTYPKPVPINNDKKLVKINVYSISFENNPIFPTLTSLTLYVFFFGCLNFHSLKRVHVNVYKKTC